MPHFIFIQQISVLNILNMLYNLQFFSSRCRLFHNATLFGFCITHILNTGCAKIKKKIRRQKVKGARGMKLNIYLHIVPNLRISGPTPALTPKRTSSALTLYLLWPILFNSWSVLVCLHLRWLPNLYKVVRKAKFHNIISYKVYVRSKWGRACLRGSFKLRRGDSLDVFAVSLK